MIAAVFTPFDNEGALNLGAIRLQAERLINDDVDGVFVCGTMGEGTSLTTAERKKVLAEWIAVAGKRLKVLVHVGHTCIEDARDLAAHAQSVGAAGIASVPPFFLKPVNTADLVACLAKVAASAPDLPFYYYHIPIATGITTPASELVPLLVDAIPNFAGIKFTDDNMADLANATMQCLPTRNVYFGRDDLLIDAMDQGVRGAVGMSYNFAGKHFRRLFDAYQNGDKARAASLQDDAKALIGLAFPQGLVNVIKAISVQASVDCGPVRLPLHTVSQEHLKELVEASGAGASLGRLLS
nr:dihydrodipicolinate synthase family protein [Burkholderia sp. Ac-20353]